MSEFAICSAWKRELDEVRTFSEAEAVVTRALAYAERPELLDFLRELYYEFRGPDCEGGGEAGTLQHLRRISKHLVPTSAELEGRGIDSNALRSFVDHG